MEREQRIELLERITDGAQISKDYIMLMILSTSLASLGLLQGSTAVVIGAMLVAPLMGPLIGAGMGITQGNAQLFRVSINGVLAGIATGFAISLLIGLLNPGFEPSMEIEARGEPDVMDLGIAFLSGFVAAYALANTKLASSVAGVAIAAALVPPLAVVGVALMIGRPIISLNAALLLTTNIVAIILGAATAFRLLGLHKSIQADNKPKWTRRTVMLLGLCAILLLIPLYQKLSTKQKTGPSRPLTLPVAADTRDQVSEFMALQPNVELITLGRISVEPDSGVVVILIAYGQVEKSLSNDLRRIIRQSRGEDVPVQVILLKGEKLEEDELKVDEKQ
jgi:uncharacterized hydrophobic protein (TIGR00271 family)